MLKSKRKRFDAALIHVENAKNIVQELLDELTIWKDNIPRNLRGSQNYYDLENAINKLKEISQNLNAINSDVEFPGAF